MSHGGAAPAYRPTAWAYLASGDCTIRWQRGDTVAYVFEGKQLDTYPDKPLKAEVLDTIHRLFAVFSGLLSVRSCRRVWGWGAGVWLR
jgi:hypothetical protein